MSIQYTNRKKKIYFIHQGKTKKGNPKYTLSQSTHKALDAIPEGYEIYENPNAQVFLRRIKPRLINKNEELLVQEVLKELIEKKYCKIIIEQKTITIYLADQDVNRMRELVKDSPKAQEEELEVIIDQIITYSPVIQLILFSPEERLFIVKMVDYEEGERIWEVVEDPGDLESLLSIICQEIDIEAYYQLLITLQKVGVDLKL